MKFLPLLLAGLSRKRARTVFTMLSVMTAFLLFGMLQGVIGAFDQALANAAVDRLTVTSKVSFTEPLPYGYLAQIESIPGVANVAYLNWFGAYFQDRKNVVFSFPLDPRRYFALYPEIKMPPGVFDKLVTTRTGAVIGRELAKKYGWKAGDRVPLHSAIWTHPGGSSDWEFDIVGVFDSPSNQAQSFFFNYDYFEEGRSFGKGTIGWFIVKVADPTQAGRLARTIDARFANSPDETKTQTEREFTLSFIKQQGDINFIVRAILGAVFFTLLFLTGNTMMQSVRERIAELAVLKTLGFTDSGVLAIVLAESLLLCLVAAGLGLAIAAVLFPALKNFIGHVHMPVSVLALGAGIAVLLALATGLPPALRARRLNIVDALAGR